MPRAELPPQLTGRHVHLVGAKGTGIAALAEILHDRGAILSGSDVADAFYTDTILHRLGLAPSVGFDAANLPPEAEFVIHSDAYGRDSNPELQAALARNLPVMNFAEALGSISRSSDASGVAGVHGKTTTTAMTGSILHALSCPVTVLAGSAVASFGGRCTLLDGERFLVAETDEYRLHFMSFSPRKILLTSVEADHQDFFPTLESIMAAFEAYVLSLPAGGLLIYCADDDGAAAIARKAAAARPDLRTAAYGFSAEGPWRITRYEKGGGESRFAVAGYDMDFTLHMPGRHLVLDAVGALALSAAIFSEWVGRPLSASELDKAHAALGDFAGSKRRSERIGESADVLFLDDYGHHPTAIAATLTGIKEFWPGRRLIVDFMSHTYSRTKALLDEFASSLDSADCLVLHRVYSSAREQNKEDGLAAALYGRVKSRHGELIDISGNDEGSSPAVPRHENFILYTEDPLDAAPIVSDLLRPGDIFLTMGAGDNWKLGRELLRRMETRSATRCS